MYVNKFYRWGLLLFAISCNSHYNEKAMNGGDDSLKQTNEEPKKNLAIIDYNNMRPWMDYCADSLGACKGMLSHENIDYTLKQIEEYLSIEERPQLYFGLHDSFEFLLFCFEGFENICNEYGEKVKSHKNKLEEELYKSKAELCKKKLENILDEEKNKTPDKSQDIVFVIRKVLENLNDFFEEQMNELNNIKNEITNINNIKFDYLYHLLQNKNNGEEYKLTLSGTIRLGRQIQNDFIKAFRTKSNVLYSHFRDEIITFLNDSFKNMMSSEIVKHNLRILLSMIELQYYSFDDSIDMSKYNTFCNKLDKDLASSTSMENYLKEYFLTESDYLFKYFGINSSKAFFTEIFNQCNSGKLCSGYDRECYKTVKFKTGLLSDRYKENLFGKDFCESQLDYGSSVFCIFRNEQKLDRILFNVEFSLDRSKEYLSIINEAATPSPHLLKDIVKRNFRALFEKLRDKKLDVVTVQLLWRLSYVIDKIFSSDLVNFKDLYTLSENYDKLCVLYELYHSIVHMVFVRLSEYDDYLYNRKDFNDIVKNVFKERYPEKIHPFFQGAIMTKSGMDAVTKAILSLAWVDSMLEKNNSESKKVATENLSESLDSDSCKFLDCNNDQKKNFDDSAKFIYSYNNKVASKEYTFFKSKINRVLNSSKSEVIPICKDEDSILPKVEKIYYEIGDILFNFSPCFSFKTYFTGISCARYNASGKYNTEEIIKKITTDGYNVLVVDNTIELPNRKTDPVWQILNDKNVVEKTKKGELAILLCKSFQKFATLGTRRVRAGQLSVIMNNESSVFSNLFKFIQEKLNDVIDAEYHSPEMQWMINILQANSADELAFLDKVSENVFLFAKFSSMNDMKKSFSMIPIRNEEIWLGALPSEVGYYYDRYRSRLMNSFGYYRAGVSEYVSEMYRLHIGLEPEKLVKHIAERYKSNLEGLCSSNNHSNPYFY